MKLVLLVSLLLVGCSSMSNTPTGGGQFVATYTGKGLGDNAGDVANGVMLVAAKQCDDKKIKVNNLTTTPPGFAQFPTATIVYECN